MRKGTFILLLALFFECFSYAQVFDFDGINYIITSEEDRTASVYRSNVREEVIIPSVVTYHDTDYKVTCIGDNAFNSCYELTSITIPESVISIEDYAFGNCIRLTTLIIPKSVTSIGSLAFYYCDGLTSITVDQNNPVFDSRNNCNAIINSSTNKIVLGCSNTVFPESITSIGDYAFSGCFKLTSLTIPQNITDISGNAFYFCGLTSITVDQNNPVFDSRNNCNAIINSSTNTIVVGCSKTIFPESVTSIGDYAFGGCFGLKSLIIPESITSIGEGAFCYCTGLTSISIPEGVTRIGGYAFSYCFNLESITIPKSVTSIGYSAFCGCAALTSITIPESVTSIGDFAFYDCINLESITIPKSVTSIGHSAFSGCIALKSINIPESVTSIGEYAFALCSGLTSITVDQNNPVFDSRNNCNAIINSSTNIIVTGCSNTVLPESIISIGEGAFYNCTGLTSISIPEGVTSIGDYAFYGCSSLSYLSLPSTLEEFGNNCFNECEGLQTAGPKGGGYNYEFCWEDVIPANAFYKLNYLKSVYIPKTVKSVYECDKVTGTGYPSSVFYGCNNLESVTVSFKDTKLMRLWRNSFIDVWDWQVYPMNYMLYEMNPIRSLTFLDDTITTLHSILTDSIKEIVISKDVKFINPMAFDYPPYYFENGSNFNFAFNADNITVENDNPNYSSIDGILFNKQGDELLVYPAGRSWCYIPESTKTIARSAFKRSKITNVSIPSNVEHIGESAFEGCDSIKWISFEGSPEIGLYAFWDCPNIESVTANNEVPGKMNTSDTPQTIMVEASSDENDESLTIRPYYNQELGRMISRISSYLRNWSCSLLSDAVIPGENKVVIGILRNTNDNMPNRFSVKIDALLTDSSVITLFTGRKGIRIQSWTAGNNDYDTITITTINIPEDCKAIRITLSTVSGNGYTNDMWLDRVFLSPDGKGLPIEAYCGPFTKEVFNNAMLYVPDGAVDTYRAADGWKLFKNICIDDAVDPITLDKINEFKDRIIYDTMGRKVETESIEQLAPGLYIIGGSTFLIQ